MRLRLDTLILAQAFRFRANATPVHNMHAGVRSFFRHAPRQLGLPPDMRLPIYAQREFSKSVWDMRVAGVKGVVNLVLIFADQHSSLAGVAVCATHILQTSLGNGMCCFTQNELVWDCHSRPSSCNVPKLRCLA